MIEHVREDPSNAAGDATVPPEAKLPAPSSATPPAESPTPLPELAELLRREAPHLFTEGRIDFERLRLALGDAVQKGQKRYGLSWAGKMDSFRQIQQAWTGKTLHPCQAESVNFDATQHLFIEGENLQVLKLLQRVYHGKVKMIYIDPPYNTGSDSFVYPDRFKEGKESYQRRAGVKDAEGNWTGDVLFRKNSRDNGHYHSNWLSMMYPRLFLARQLLRDDGVVFVSIDDNEMHNLRAIMDEIFGEENFLASIVWEKRFTRSNNSKLFASLVEHILCYRKTESLDELKEPRNEKADSIYSNPDNDPRGVWTSVSYVNPASKAQRPNLCYPVLNPITGQSIEHPSNAWKYEKATYERHAQENRLYWGKEGDNQYPRLKKFLAEMEGGMVPVDLWTYRDTGSTDEGSKDLESLLKGKYFDFPKPAGLVQRMMKMVTNEGDLILDFFSGSATTAQAVLELNRQDGGNRRFICVQLPEPTPESSAARQAGYATIAEIGKERIRRVIKKLQEDDKGKLPDMQRPTPEDLGFKVFKLAERGLREWECLKVSAEELAKQLEMFTETVRPDAKSDDLLYELILDGEGELAAPVERMEIGGGVWHRVDGGRLAICVERTMTPELVEDMLAAKPQKLICLDAAFSGNDPLKKNTALQLEAAKIEFKAV